MLAEVLLRRDPRSVSEISAPQVIAPINLLAAVLLRRDRPPLVPTVGVQAAVYDFQKSIINDAGVVTLVNDSVSPGLLKVYGTNASGIRGWRNESGGGGGAPTNAHYLTTQAEAGLGDEFDLSAIGSGLLKQSVSAGVSTPAIAVAGVDYVDPTDVRLNPKSNLAFGFRKSTGITVGKLPGFWTCPFAGTISAWNITVDTGTITLKIWKIATGTAHPTSANSINSTGISLATGTAIHSATVTDFTTLAVAVGDIFAVEVTAVSGVTDFGGSVEITRS